MTDSPEQQSTPKHSVSVAGVVVREDGRLLAIRRADNGTAAWTQAMSAFSSDLELGVKDVRGDGEEPSVVWALEGYSTADESLRTEHPISREQILRLREVIKPDADDPWMIYCYAVALEAWPAVDAVLRCGPPDPELEYFTSAYASE